MDNFLPADVQAGLDAARRVGASKRKGKRLAVEADGVRHKVLDLWEGGFSVDANTPPLRGVVDIYDSAVHIKHCLIIAANEEAGVLSYEFKLASRVMDGPPLDFVQAPDAPIALLRA